MEADGDAADHHAVDAVLVEGAEQVGQVQWHALHQPVAASVDRCTFARGRRRTLARTPIVL